MMDDDPGQGTILVADDVPANLDVLLTCLNADNYRVLVAEDGENAVERARRALPETATLIENLRSASRSSTERSRSVSGY